MFNKSKVPAKYECSESTMRLNYSTCACPSSRCHISHFTIKGQFRELILSIPLLQPKEVVAPLSQRAEQMEVRDSSIGTATMLRAGWPTNQGSIPVRGVQTGSRAHPDSYTMDIWGCFPGGKAVREWSWPFSLSSGEVRNGSWLLTAAARVRSQVR
jgi:hypothetical protein